MVGPRAFCPVCAARPEIDYLEKFRLKHWGRRDGWAWLWGLGVLLNLGWAGLAFSSGQAAAGAMSVAFAAGGVCYFLGLPWARSLIFLPPLGAFAVPFLSPSLPAADPAFLVGQGLGFALVPALVSVAVYRDALNQLFFKVHPTQKKLERAWNLYANNWAARTGFLLSLLWFLVPLVALVGLGLSIHGLRQVNPAAHPPIGRKGRAIAGIVLGTLGAMWWAGVLVESLVTRKP